MLNGTVKWFNEGKGFGFIASGGKDYFVHYKEIKGDGFRTLKDGAIVQFNAATSPKGPIATDVQLVE